MALTKAQLLKHDFPVHGKWCKMSSYSVAKCCRSFETKKKNTETGGTGPSQGQTGQNGDFTVELNRKRPVCPRDGSQFVPRRGPVCPKDGSYLSQTPSRPKCLCLLVFSCPKKKHRDRRDGKEWLCPNFGHEHGLEEGKRPPPPRFQLY